MILFQLIAGLILLIAGAEIMVKGAARIATAFRISPLVIGLTVVAFGTSSPELAVSVVSALNGNPDIAMGNVIGSNIFNILAVLGLASLFIPLIVQQQIIRLDVPVLIALTMILFLFGINGSIGFVEGTIFILLGVAYTIFVIRLSRKESDKGVLDEYGDEYGPESKSATDNLTVSVILVIVGLVMLVFGSRWLVSSAVELAQMFGLSDLVIGITIIAVGTSLPEVATSVIAAIRGESDIAVGNAVGSSIFNIVFILGIAAVVGGGLNVSPAALRFDIPVMIAVSIACLPFFFSGRRLERWEGIVFLFYYCAYATYLVLASQNEEESLDIFTMAMTWFTIPLTILTLGVLTVREMRRRNGSGTKGDNDPGSKRTRW